MTGLRLAANVVVLAFGVGLLITQAATAQAEPPQLRQASVEFDGGSVAYRIGGEGPPVMLIHGGIRTGHDWDKFLDELAKHFTVILPDLPGHGHSSRHSSGWSLGTMARGMFAILDDLGIERIRGVGHSLGANTWLHMSVQQPSRVHAMVLIGGAHRVTGAWREDLGALTLDTAPPVFREYYRRYHPGGETQARALYKDARSLKFNYDDFGFSPERLGTIPAKTLLMLGDRDPVVPVSMAAEMYNAMPNAFMWVLPNQDHWPIWPEYGGSPDAEAIFVSTIRRFFEEPGSE